MARERTLTQAGRNVRWCGSGGLAQEVGVHDPAMGGPRVGPGAGDVVRDIGQGTGAKDLVRRAEIGAPPDVEAGEVEVPEARLAVEHDEDGFGTRRPALVPEPPPGGDVDGAVHSVERDRVGRRQGLDGGDAGDDADLRFRRQPFGDAERAVIERRVAPDEKGDRAGGGGGRDGRGPAAGDFVVPGRDAGVVGKGRVAGGVVEGDDLRGCAGGRDQALAEGGEIFLFVAFEGEEDRGGVPHGLPPFEGHVRLAACADADEPEVVSHRPAGRRGSARPSCRSLRPSLRPVPRRSSGGATGPGC